MGKNHSPMEKKIDHPDNEAEPDTNLNVCLQHATVDVVDLEKNLPGGIIPTHGSILKNKISYGSSSLRVSF